MLECAQGQTRPGRIGDVTQAALVLTQFEHKMIT
jgi:hypothetical protein